MHLPRKAPHFVEKVLQTDPNNIPKIRFFFKKKQAFVQKLFMTLTL